MQYLLLTALWLGVLMVQSVSAQTVLSVPLQTGQLVWDAPVATPTSSLPTGYIISCGASITRLAAPATSIPVRDFIQGPGSYTCTIAAENGFGSSPTVPVPAFVTGYVPDSPLNLRLEVR
jgi:hypothetical protein